MPCFKTLTVAEGSACLVSKRWLTCFKTLTVAEGSACLVSKRWTFRQFLCQPALGLLI